MEFMPRRVVWSPDGSVVVCTGFGSEMVVSGDGGVVFAKRWPDTVSACAWYPGMRRENEASCAFATAVPRCPVQLIDGVDGHVRASYRCHYGGDRMASVTSVLFSGDGIVAGSTKSLFRCAITRSDQLGEVVVRVQGSILALAACESGVIAAGTSIGEVILVDPRNWEILGSSSAHDHGVDVVQVNKTKLLSSAKLENRVFMYDLRMPSLPELSLETCRKSSRYVSVSSAGDHIALGSEDGPARLFSISSIDPISTHGTGTTPIAELNPTGNRLALASGDWLITDTDASAEFSPHLRAFNITNL